MPGAHVECLAARAGGCPGASPWSRTIKRIGSHLRMHVEPAVKRHRQIPEDLTLWQDYLTDPSTRQRLSLFGNIGFTVLVGAVAVVAVGVPFRPIISTSVLVAIAVLAAADLASYGSVRRLGKIWRQESDG